LIVQKYIENPLLINNKKFDINSFVLIANTDPFLVLFHLGYLISTLVEFDMELKSWDISEKMKHLPNSYTQEQHPSYEWLRNDHGFTFPEFINYL